MYKVCIRWTPINTYLPHVVFKIFFFFLIVKKETGLIFSVIIFLVGYSDEMTSSRADRQTDRQAGWSACKNARNFHGLHVLPDGVNALPYGTSNEVNSGVFHTHKKNTKP